MRHEHYSFPLSLSELSETPGDPLIKPTPGSGTIHFRAFSGCDLDLSLSQLFANFTKTKFYKSVSRKSIIGLIPTCSMSFPRP